MAEKHGYSSKSLAYGSDKSQEIKFDIVTEVGIEDGCSILDVGCGFGDYFNYLKQKGIKNVKYCGIDISNKIVDFAKEKNSYRISIGKFGKIIDLIKKQKSNKVLFAGKIAKPKFSTLRLDLKGIYYMPSIIKADKLGDAAILKELINILSENKIKVISLNRYNPELTLKKGCFTKLKPNMTDKLTIKKGIQIMRKFLLII